MARRTGAGAAPDHRDNERRRLAAILRQVTAFIAWCWTARARIADLKRWICCETWACQRRRSSVDAPTTSAAAISTRTGTRSRSRTSRRVVHFGGKRLSARCGRLAEGRQAVLDQHYGCLRSAMSTGQVTGVIVASRDVTTER